MAEPSQFRGALDIMNRLGLYDVVLPFLLIFTLTFALLEKTRVLGTEEVDGTRYPKRNLNSMMALVIALFFVASAQMVEVVIKISSWAILALLGLIIFLLLYGAFQREGEEGTFLPAGPLRTTFVIAVLVGVVLIFLNGFGYLTQFFDYLQGNWESNVVATVIFLFVIFGALWWIVGSSPGGGKKRDDND